MEVNIKNTHQTPSNLLFLLLIVLLGLGIGLRLFDLTDQPIDFHSTRQLRSAIIARGMYYDMSPSIDDHSRNLAIKFWESTGQYEPSILERIVAETYLFIGEEYFWIARIYNTFFWTIGGLVLFRLSRRMAYVSLKNSDPNKNGKAAYWSALIVLTYYLILPFSVQASRSFQPDPLMVVGITLSAFCTYRWSETLSWKWAILCGLFSGFAVLTKAVAAFTIAGLLTTLTIYAFHSPGVRGFLQSILKAVCNPQVWSILILAVFPTAIYYISRGDRAGEYFTSWTLSLSHLLLEPWLYARWLNLVRRLMGVLPLILVGVSILLSRKRNLALLLGLWGGYLIYGFFLPYQMYTHNYYHLQLVSIIAISMTPTITKFTKKIFALEIHWRYLLSAGLLIWILFSSWVALQPLYGQDYRNEPAYWQEIASYLPEDGKIIALTQDYGYRLMYYGWRKVTLWPNQGEQNLSILRNSEKDPYEYFIKRTKDISYFLVTSFNQFEKQPTLQKILYENYSLIAENTGFLIFDLKQ